MHKYKKSFILSLISNEISLNSDQENGCVDEQSLSEDIYDLFVGLGLLSEVSLDEELHE